MTNRVISPSSMFELHPVGPFSLAASGAFAGNATQLCIASPSGTDGHLHLAFVPDGEGERPVGACIHEGSRPGTIAVELFGTLADPAAIVDQVARILSMDVDATGWASIGETDPVLGALLDERPGFRPVNFLSPYESAAWLMLTHRSRMSQATVIRTRIAEELGADVDIHGDLRRAFPGPAALLRLGAVEGLPQKKAAWLRALAEAAHSDLLHGARLRALDAATAMAELRTLPGVGPFTAEGIVLRGAGAPDVLAFTEPRLRASVAQAYGLDIEPSDDALTAMAERWRPYRSWAQVLLRWQ